MFNWLKLFVGFQRTFCCLSFSVCLRSLIHWYHMISLPLYAPTVEPTEARRGGWIRNWNFCGASGGQKCHLMTIIGACTRLVTIVHAPFSPPLLLVLAFKPIFPHTIVTEGRYMLCSIEEFFFFFKKVEQSCLTVVWQMTCQMPHIYLCASCWHHVLVLLVQFALVYSNI